MTFWLICIYECSMVPCRKSQIYNLVAQVGNWTSVVSHIDARSHTLKLSPSKVAKESLSQVSPLVEISGEIWIAQEQLISPLAAQHYLQSGINSKMSDVELD